MASPRYLRLPDGTVWPRPSMETDEDLGPAWRLTYAPDAITRVEQIHAAAMIEAYGTLIDTPDAARKLPAIRRALRNETTT